AEVGDQRRILRRIEGDTKMGCLYGLERGGTLDGRGHKFAVGLYTWVWGNLQQAFKRLQGFRITPQFKQRLPQDKTPYRMLWFTRQALFSPLPSCLWLPAL